MTKINLHEMFEARMNEQAINYAKYNTQFDDEYANDVRAAKVGYTAALNDLHGIVDGLVKRLESAIWFQEKLKNYISHHDDCNALIDEESEGPCECGMEEFAHNNYISQNMAKEQIEKLNTFLASVDSHASHVKQGDDL